MNTNEHQWFAVRVKTRFERTAESSLAARGVNCFSPSYTVSSKRSARSKLLSKPLFPGYLFCQFDFGRRLPVLMSPGVIEIVSFGNMPTPVDPEEIEALQTVVSSGKDAQRHPFLRAGARVRLRGGPLRGLEGYLVEINGDHRLILTVNLLQRAVSVEVDEADVEVTEPARHAPGFFGDRRAEQAFYASRA